jgi:hypothetical protein
MDYKFLLLLIIATIINADDNIDQLKKDFEEIKTTKHRSKILSCMALLTNTLKQGNELFKSTISGTDKSKSYDKFIAVLLNNCIDTIKDNDIDKVRLI